MSFGGVNWEIFRKCLVQWAALNDWRVQKVIYKERDGINSLIMTVMPHSQVCKKCKMIFLFFFYIPTFNPSTPPHFSPPPISFTFPPTFLFLFLPSFKLPDNGSFNFNHFSLGLMNPWEGDLGTGQGLLLPTSLSIFPSVFWASVSEGGGHIFSSDLQGLSRSFTWIFLLFSCTHGRSSCPPPHAGLLQARLPTIPTQPSQATSLPVGCLLLEIS